MSKILLFVIDFVDCREAEKRSLQLAKEQELRQQQQQQQQQQHRLEEKHPNLPITIPSKEPEKRVESGGTEDPEKENKRQKNEDKSPRPPSSRGPRYPGSILHGRDPTYMYQRRERKKVSPACVKICYKLEVCFV